MDTNAYHQYRGAVKSNIGHLGGASGLAALVKTILVLEKGIIPPNANFEKLNPRIDAEFLKVKVSAESSRHGSVEREACAVTHLCEIMYKGIHGITQEKLLRTY